MRKALLVTIVWYHKTHPTLGAPSIDEESESVNCFDLKSGSFGTSNKMKNWELGVEWKIKNLEKKYSRFIHAREYGKQANKSNWQNEQRSKLMVVFHSNSYEV
jgi:hypothetical protein